MESESPQLEYLHADASGRLWHSGGLGDLNGQKHQRLVGHLLKYSKYETQTGTLKTYTGICYLSVSRLDYYLFCQHRHFQK